MLEAMVQFFQQISPIATPIAIIGIILAIIFYLRSRRARKPSFFMRSYNLVTDFSSKLDKLQLLYGNTNIENLTVSKIAFWNDGAETIEWSHIVEADPVRIEAVGKCDIIDAYVIKENNTANKFRVEVVNSKSVKILFDYIDKGEGGVIQLIHTGKESTDIELTGSVKGSGKLRSSYGYGLLAKIGKKLFGPPKKKKERPAQQRRAIGIFLLIYSIFMIIVAITAEELVNRIVGGIFVLILFYLSYYMFKRRVPRGLEIVEEEEIL